MKVTFLGTGTSQGIPVIACQCRVCKSTDPRDKRFRSAVMIEQGDKTIVIDTGPDFRQQMLANDVRNLTAIVFTHEHKDHVAGLDDVRAFNFIMGRAIDVYAESRVQERLRREFAYVFVENQYPGTPRINMHLIENKKFEIEGIEILPIRAMHYELPVFGFRIGDFAYLTDVNYIDEQEMKKLSGVKHFVISALRKEKHISHFSLSEALEVIARIHPQRAYLTHLNHQFGLHAEEEPQLPDNVFIAYDGLTIDV